MTLNRHKYMAKLLTKSNIDSITIWRFAVSTGTKTFIIDLWHMPWDWFNVVHYI